MTDNLVFSGESKNIEYKVSLPDKSEKYMKTIIAFANTQGGKLIIGVDDKTHQVVGVKNDIYFRRWILLRMLCLTLVYHKLFQILNHRL